MDNCGIVRGHVTWERVHMLHNCRSHLLGACSKHRFLHALPGGGLLQLGLPACCAASLLAALQLTLRGADPSLCPLALCSSFGAKAVDPKPIMKALPSLFAHTQAGVRDKAKETSVELAAYLGQVGLGWGGGFTGGHTAAQDRPLCTAGGVQQCEAKGGCTCGNVIKRAVQNVAARTAGLPCFLASGAGPAWAPTSWLPRFCSAVGCGGGCAAGEDACGHAQGRGRRHCRASGGQEAAQPVDAARGGGARRA